MANVLINEDTMTDIADAIRSKKGVSTTYLPGEMPSAIQSISGGGITPTGTKSISITANGVTTEDVTNYASAQITANVPNSYSASDEGKVVSSGALVAQTSQNITENGTYDTTLKNSVNVNVASSGGAHTEEGYIELSDTTVGNVPGVTIPVNLTSATGFILNVYVVETGEVSGGVVTKYDHIEIPTAFADNSHSFVWNYMLKYPLNPTPTVYRDSTNLSTVVACYNTSYTHARRSMNGSQIGLVITPTIAASGLTVTTMNGTRFFCVAGAYAKFKYEIKWW